MRQRQPLLCDCGCGEPIRCDRCGEPLLEGDAHYVLGMSIMRGYNDRTRRDVLAGFPLVVRHLRCGAGDLYRTLEVKDPNLELVLLDGIMPDPGDRRDIN